MTDEAAAEEGVFGTSGMLQALREQLSIGFQDGVDRIVASANARLNRQLGDGFRSEGKLSSAGIAGVRLLSDHLQIDLRADGRLKLVYGG